MPKYNKYCKKCGEKLLVPSWTCCQDCSYKPKYIKKIDPPIKKEKIEVQPVKYELVEIIDKKCREKYKRATVIVMNGNKIVGYSNTL